jgi:hypothetical protein
MPIAATGRLRGMTRSIVMVCRNRSSRHGTHWHGAHGGRGCVLARSIALLFDIAPMRNFQVSAPSPILLRPAIRPRSVPKLVVWWAHVRRAKLACDAAAGAARRARKRSSNSPAGPEPAGAEPRWIFNSSGRAAAGAVDAGGRARLTSLKAFKRPRGDHESRWPRHARD